MLSAVRSSSPTTCMATSFADNSATMRTMLFAIVANQRMTLRTFCKCDSRSKFHSAYLTIFHSYFNHCPSFLVSIPETDFYVKYPCHYFTFRISTTCFRCFTFSPRRSHNLQKMQCVCEKFISPLLTNQAWKTNWMTCLNG